MIDGLEIVLNALSSATGYAAIVAVMYLFVELLKVAAICMVPVFVVKHIKDAYINAKTIKKYERQVCLSKRFITSDGTYEDLLSFLEIKIIGDGHYIHASDVNKLRRAWDKAYPATTSKKES